MSKTVKFYTKAEVTELRAIKSIPRGKTRTNALMDFAAKYGRNLTGVRTKLYTLKAYHRRGSSLSPSPVSVAARASEVRIPFKSIAIEGNDLIIVL